jgi:hypothetical protein
METITYGPWQITLDRAATVAAHAVMPTGGAEECSCSDCANFARQKPMRYPQEFLDLLERLGIDPNLEIEVWSWETERMDSRQYAGWFYFIGHVEGQGLRNVGSFEWFLSEGPNFMVKEFEGQPISKVEFTVRIPVVGSQPAG